MQPGSVQGWPGLHTSLATGLPTAASSDDEGGAGDPGLLGDSGDLGVLGSLGDAGDLGVPGDAGATGAASVLSRLIRVVLMGRFRGRAVTARGRNLSSLVRLSISDKFLFKTCVVPV